MELEKVINQKKFRSEAHKFGVNLIYTFNWANGFHGSLLKSFGITSQQFNVLRILRGQSPNPASVKLIRERMLDKMSDASRIVEKLRVKGLIDRKICPMDRRAADVVITDKGLQLLSKIDGQNESFDNIFSNLTSAELQQLNFLLDKLRGND